MLKRFHDYRSSTTLLYLPYRCSRSRDFANEMKKYLTLLAAIAVSIYLLSVSPAVMASQAGKAYIEADDRLNQVYQVLRSKINSSSDKQRLVIAEQTWIKFRDADVNFYSRYYVNSKGGLFLKTKLTEDRHAYLQSILKELPQQQGNDVGPI
jgi:uncharacterized protein YecT (DUF1311 family)